MQILFIFPAKIYLADLPPLNDLTIAGAQFKIINGRAWYDMKAGKLKINKCEGVHILCHVENNIYAPLAFYSSLESAENAINYHVENKTLEKVLDHAKNIIKDIPAYEEKVAADIAEKQKQDVINKAEKELKSQAANIAANEAFETNIIRQIKNFKEGRGIKWDDFETICKRHKINMHLRTIGAGREGIITIAHNKANTRGKVSCNGAFIAAKQLYTILTTN